MKLICIIIVLHLLNPFNLFASAVQTVSRTSVWQARALLKAIENVDYFNNCELLSAPEVLVSAARTMQTNEKLADVIKTPQYFTLFPNPNDGNFKLTLNNAGYANYEIEILNSFGSLVKQYKVNSTENKEALLVNELNQGIYFVIIKANNIVLETKKVIVSK